MDSLWLVEVQKEWTAYPSSQKKDGVKRHAFVTTPKWFKLFCALQWKEVWLVSWSENTPGAQHTRWDLLFERTFRGGHFFLTKPNSARFFSGSKIPILASNFWFPLKKGGISWSLEFPKLDPPNAERLSWKTKKTHLDKDLQNVHVCWISFAQD